MKELEQHLLLGIQPCNLGQLTALSGQQTSEFRAVALAAGDPACNLVTDCVPVIEASWGLVTRDH